MGVNEWPGVRHILLINEFESGENGVLHSTDSYILCYAYTYSFKRIFGLCIILSCISS